MAPQRADSPLDPEESAFDSQQDVARGGFADMLFDTSRVSLLMFLLINLHFSLKISTE
jgi:hypothetical protein